MDTSLVVVLNIVAAFHFSAANAVTSFKEPSPCGDWTAYKDEKCVKIAIHAGYQTQQDAEIVCESFSEGLNRETYPRVITIKTKEEQDFMHKFLFVDNHIQDPVWLGLKEQVNGSAFYWNDGSTPYFTNWANQTVIDDQHHCVQMESGEGIVSAGLWVKVKCTKASRVVCERTQTVSLETLQNMFFAYKLEQEIEMKNLKQRNDAAEKKIADLKQVNDEAGREITRLKENPVPVGFTYTQLPSQEPPTTLWPNTKWTDVSAQYAGLFFRVVGGKAAPFGQIQEGNSSRLEEVNTAATQVDRRSVLIPPGGGWSEFICTGATGAQCYFSRFRLSTEEVRPRNQAMKVWQRIK